MSVRSSDGQLHSRFHSIVSMQSIELTPLVCGSIDFKFLGKMDIGDLRLKFLDDNGNQTTFYKYNKNSIIGDVYTRNFFFKAFHSECRYSLQNSRCQEFFLGAERLFFRFKSSPVIAPTKIASIRESLEKISNKIRTFRK